MQLLSRQSPYPQQGSHYQPQHYAQYPHHAAQGYAQPHQSSAYANSQYVNQQAIQNLILFQQYNLVQEQNLRNQPYQQHRQYPNHNARNQPHYQPKNTGSNAGGSKQKQTGKNNNADDLKESAPEWLDYDESSGNQEEILFKTFDKDVIRQNLKEKQEKIVTIQEKDEQQQILLDKLRSEEKAGLPGSLGQECDLKLIDQMLEKQYMEEREKPQEGGMEALADKLQNELSLQDDLLESPHPHPVHAKQNNRKHGQGYNKNKGWEKKPYVDQKQQNYEYQKWTDRQLNQQLNIMSNSLMKEPGHFMRFAQLINQSYH